MRYIVLAVLLVIGLPQVLQADLFMRVVDTGAGLCCVIRTPSDEYIVYDFGHWNATGYRAYMGVKDMVPPGEPIALAVISHSDSDHAGGTKRVFDEYQVNKVVRPNVDRDTGTWASTIQAIADEPNCEDINIENDPLPDPIMFGETKVTFVAGWNLPPDSWGLSGGEYLNAGSICVRIEYAGKSILLCGDAVGRHRGDPADVCIASEEFMCDNAATTPIDSDILIAPHHGADNGSSTRFIQQVSPTWVIFSAGHGHQHPTYAAAQRFLNNGVALSNIFRTDLGDDEAGQYEWWHGRIPGHSDGPGDDDVDIRIKETGFVSVEYRHDGSLSFSDPAAAPWNARVPEEVLLLEKVPEEVLFRREYGADFIDDDGPVAGQLSRAPVVQACPVSHPTNCRQRFRLFRCIKGRRR